MLKVAQETSLSLTAYRVGRSYATYQDLDNDALWLRTQVLSMGSPISLAKTMRERHVKLVAWSKSEPVILTPTVVAELPEPTPTDGTAQLAKVEAEE